MRHRPEVHLPGHLALTVSRLVAAPCLHLHTLYQPPAEGSIVAAVVLVKRVEKVRGVTWPIANTEILTSESSKQGKRVRIRNSFQVIAHFEMEEKNPRPRVKVSVQLHLNQVLGPTFSSPVLKSSQIQQV